MIDNLNAVNIVPTIIDTNEKASLINSIDRVYLG